MEDTTAVSFLPHQLQPLLTSRAAWRHHKSIDQQLKTIYDFLQASPADSDSRSRELLKLVSAIRHVAYDAIDRVAAQAASHRFRTTLTAFLFGPNPIADLRKKAALICKQIDQVYKDQERFSLKTIDSRREDDEGDDSALRSFRKDVGKSELGFAEEKMLKRKLLEPGSQVVSLVGMGGLGKTSLARRIFFCEHVEQHFNCRAWVWVSQEYDIRKLLETIFHQCNLSIPLPEEEEDLRKALSHSLQHQGNRYLIVLDDVWNVKFWDQIKNVFPGNPNGSRILITSRNKRVASSACPSPPQQLKPMSADDSWELFMEKIRSANMLEEMEMTLELHKDKILRKCDGLPLAIVSFAGGLVATADNCSDQLFNYYIDDDVISCLPRTEFRSLVMSYNALPLHLRRCFLYFGLFPRNFDIPVRRLYRLWLAEGFAPLNSETTPLKSPEDMVEEYLQDLVDRNMIQMSKFKSDGSPKTCRMPGILRDIFLNKAEEIGLFYIHRNSNSTAATTSQLPVRRVIEHMDIEFIHSNVDVQHVRSYISFNTMKNDIPAVGIGLFIRKVIRVQRYGILRVLDLEHVYKPKLPEELGKLYYLRYLGLRWTFLDSLPSSVGDLSYLETLDIKHTYITSLPNSIWKIKKLRHLLLNEIRLDMTLHRKLMSPPTQLQTLWGLYVDKKSPVKNGLDRLVNLRKLGLTCHPDSIPEVSQWIAKLSSLETLKLRCKDIHDQRPLLSLDHFSRLGNLTDLYLVGKLKKLPASNEFPPKIRVLTLSISELEEDPMPVLSQLPHLKVLKLYARSYLGETMDCSTGGFSSLHRLRLWMLRNLRQVEIRCCRNQMLQNLRQVEIRCCDNLEELPGILVKRSALERIVFTNMEEVAKKLKARKQEDKTITVTIKDRTRKFDD